MYNKETSVVGFFPVSPHSLLVSFPNVHNINKVPHAEDFRNKIRLLVVYVINNYNNVITDAKLLWATNKNEFRFRNIQGQTICTKPQGKLR